MGPFIPCRKEEVQGSCPEACLLLYFFLRVRRSVEEGRWSANERACVLRFLREFGTAFLGNRSPAFDAYLRQRIRSEDRLCWRAEREAALRLKKTEEEFLKYSRVARIATADERGMPHVVPVCHLWEQGCVYFGTARESKKVHNLERNSQIALAVDDYTDAWRTCGVCCCKGMHNWSAEERNFGVSASCSIKNFRSMKKRLRWKRTTPSLCVSFPKGLFAGACRPVLTEAVSFS